MNGTIQFRDALRTALNYIFQSLPFFVANVIAIGMGVVLVLLMLSLGMGIRSNVDRFMQNEGSLLALDVSVRPGTAGGEQIDQARLDGLAAIPDVERVVPVIEGVAADLEGRGGLRFMVFLMSAVEEDPEIRNSEFLSGRPSFSGAEGDGIIVPLVVLNQVLPVHPDSAIRKTVQLLLERRRGGGYERAAIPLRIAGVARGTKSSRCYASLPLMQQINQWKAGLTDAVVYPEPLPRLITPIPGYLYDRAKVYAKSRQSLEPLRKTIERGDYRTFSPLDKLRQYQEMALLVTVVLGAIGGVSLLTGSISIFNASHAAVMRRTREIGILKTCGATHGTILLIMMTEAVLTALCAGLGGCLLGTLVCILLRAPGLTRSSVVLFPITWQVILIPFGLAVLLSCLATLRPALRAAELTAVEALRDG